MKIKSLEIEEIRLVPDEGLHVSPIRNQEAYELLAKKLSSEGTAFLPQWKDLTAGKDANKTLYSMDCWFEITVRICINGTDRKWLIFEFDRAFISDLASVPWFLRSFVDNDAWWIIAAALVHDWLYITKGADVLSFSAVNKLFLRMCEYEAKQRGMSMAKPRLAYAAVQLAGYPHWKKQRKIWEKQGVELEISEIN